MVTLSQGKIRIDDVGCDTVRMVSRDIGSMLSAFEVTIERSGTTEYKPHASLSDRGIEGIEYTICCSCFIYS